MRLYKRIIRKLLVIVMIIQLYRSLCIMIIKLNLILQLAEATAVSHYHENELKQLKGQVGRKK